jgi:nucleoside-diphosphate-sugar epimerase
LSALSHVRRGLLQPAVVLQNRLPAIFFSRGAQMLVDAVFSAVSLFLAYHLRFDSGVPPDERAVMYVWMPLLAVLRPALMWRAGLYQLTWRYFDLGDALKLAAGAGLSTAVLLLLRLTFYIVPLAANPLSVIVIEAVIFVLLATAARTFRRLMSEESIFADGHNQRVLLVGSERLLPAAIHQVTDRDLGIVGCLVPECRTNLLGIRICGCPVLGAPAALNGLLQRRSADLVMVTDASLDCIGDVVATATQHGVEVRLLPTAQNVIRGDVSISVPRRASKDLDRVLVLGGAGYLGSMLVPMLLARGYKVRVLDRLLFGSEPLASVAKDPAFELVVGDVRDLQAVVAATKGCDAVVDLAAIVGDPACAVNRQLSLEVNRAATRMLIEVCKGYGVNRIVFASTCSVYGASDYLVDELTPPTPISIYAETKVTSEELLLEAASGDFHPVMLRLGTLFGLSPRPRFDLVVNLLTARAATTGKITIFNGEQWRPFLHVRDAARAFLAALEAPADAVASEIFNVGDYSLNMRLSAVSAKIAEVIPAVSIEHVENGDKRNYRASFDKIHTRLGFRCEKSIEFGIREIYAAVHSNQIADFTASQFNNQIVTQSFAAADGAAEYSMRKLARLAA